MKSIVVIFMSLFLLGNMMPTNAQTNSLTSEELEMFRTEVKHRTNRFQMYLTFIASKKNDNDTKRAYVKQALKLFIGKGEVYKDVYDNEQPAVRVQLSDTKTGKKYWRKTKDYLNNLIKLSYRKLEITWMDACRVGEFHKIGEGRYITTVTIYQRFEGVKDSGAVTVNNDEKTITVYLEEEVTSVGGRYRVLFGDIEIQQTY